MPDMVVSCLVLASSRSAGSLAPVLAKTAQAARDSASMMRQIDAGRRASQSQAKLVAIVTGLIWQLPIPHSMTSQWKRLGRASLLACA